MKVYHSLEEITSIKNPVLTTGTFDGVHIGHKKIIDTLCSTAKAYDGETVLFTFFPHPRMVLFPDDFTLQLLNTQSEKIRLLEEAGIDHLIIYPFSKEFARLSAEEFVSDILIGRIGMKKMAIGYDHQFGKNREGDLKHLLTLGAKYHFEVAEIPAQMVDEVNVSSTKIRNALALGDVATAANYLGYHYAITGSVKKGQQLGRTIGYPTANISVNDSYKQIPEIGVYAVRIDVAGVKYGGMMNIGFRPTVNSHDKVRHLEVHIFDFSEEIYENDITISFINRLRNEERFQNLDALKEQLQKDEQNARQILRYDA